MILYVKTDEVRFSVGMLCTSEGDFGLAQSVGMQGFISFQKGRDRARRSEKNPSSSAIPSMASKELRIPTVVTLLTNEQPHCMLPYATSTPSLLESWQSASSIAE
jgi:hypothetical protein